MILNRQNKIALDEESLTAFLARILRELQLGGTEVAIAFVTDQEIARWNKKYRGKSGPTDVLSFPALNAHRVAHFKRKARSKGAKQVGHLAPAPSMGYLGDIAIAPATAQRYAQINRRALEDELRVLMLHGLLHLLGYDHETDRGQMNRVERKIRRRLEIV